MSHNIFNNLRKPADTFAGRMMMKGMNFGHNPCSLWALSLIDFGNPRKLLDIGCGGGKNIANLLKAYPQAKVFGMDYSAASVRHSLKFNRKAVTQGRCEVIESDVQDIRYPDNTFDGITAFETVYFWPNFSGCLKGIVGKLKPRGIFMICNEVFSPKGQERWSNLLDMNIYTGGELKDYMERAGLDGVEVHEHPNGKWMCVYGHK